MNHLNDKSMPEFPRVILKPKRDAPVKRRHPWLFSGSIARVEGNPEPGALVAVHSSGPSDQTFLAWGHYSPHSQIRVRMVSWNPQAQPEPVDFWRARLQDAIAARHPVLFKADRTNVCRLINAESDSIPGLIVDRYDHTLVVQYLTAGIEARRDLWPDLLLESTRDLTGLDITRIYERSDVDVRSKEGLKPRAGLLYGEEPPERLEVLENGLRFLVDIRQGHKSGFYLDQRENRQRLREVAATLLTQDRKAPTLLNVFAYSSGFAVYGLSGGCAAAVNVDTSADALTLGRANLAANGIQDTRSEDIEGDAFEVLRALRAENRKFDLIVLDPPKFAFRREDIRKATRGYKDINMQAFHLLRPGGLLFTFSCSGVISADLFQKVIFGAALDAQREAQIVGRMTQSSDHPVALTFPEGEYLKGLICRLMD
jgi:23S rRNA (cytosine1962-C5)-methyltransferase